MIRAFNEDKPYERFVLEQVAGDVLYPGARDGIEATGFIAAGPWDFIGHAEVPETKLDGQVARLLDRDDMVSNTLNTFASLTVQCARCHDHKFDPVSQEDYYSLQAVFAALDRADRPYDADPAVADSRTHLMARRTDLVADRDRILVIAKGRAGGPLVDLERKLVGHKLVQGVKASRSPEYGYHSALSSTPDAIRWVQVDLGRRVAIARVVLHACDDDFNGIGPGFGFPPRFKIEASDDPTFRSEVAIVTDRTGEDFANPRLRPVIFPSPGVNARYVRVTATRLAPRQNDYNFALAEIEVTSRAGPDAARGSKVSALDTIEAPPRWRLSNLVDGDYPVSDPQEIPILENRRDALILASLDEEDRQSLDEVNRSLAEIDRQVASLPPQRKVYAGTIHHGSGSFRGTGPNGGKPRVIRVLGRGEVRDPETRSSRPARSRSSPASPPGSDFPPTPPRGIGGPLWPVG